jgi:hypothetical protein
MFNYPTGAGKERNDMPRWPSRQGLLLIGWLDGEIQYLANPLFITGS